MKNSRLKNRQRTYMGTRLRIVVAASIFAAASLLLIVVFNLSEVEETRAFSSGDFRTVASGEWNETSVWETYDGKDWSEAHMPPGEGSYKVLVSAGNELTLSEEMVLSEIIIDEGGRLNIETNTVKLAAMNGKSGITCNGTLSLGTGIIEGEGDLIIGAKATLMTGNENGIDKAGKTGSIQLKGKKEFSKDAQYIFNGSILQNTGNGLPAIMRNLTIDNTSGVQLDQSIFVLDKINLIKGNLITGKYTLTIGTSPIATGEIERVSGAICGKVKRWYGQVNNKNVMFPVSDGSTVNIFTFASGTSEADKGMIEMNFNSGKLEKNSDNPFEARHVVVGIGERGYYTAFLSNGPDECWLKITSALTGSNNENKISWKIDKNTKSQTANNGTTNVPGKIAKTDNIQNIIFGPNPFKENFFVRFYSEAATKAHIQLMNSAGQIVFNDAMEVTEGVNQYEYVPKQILTPGTYVLQVNNTSEIHTLKVVKGN
ncbi:MAG TPA: T9SS type A sorting domain-containing protein [Bacteroidia bacterium]|nr:T9SS type A sorting domain-containing protein [Bacteroidia bacterium]